MTSIILLLAMSLRFSFPASLQTTDSSKGLPTVEQVLAKYAQGTGGSAAQQKLTTRVAKGEWENVTRGVRLPIEIYSKAPKKRVEILDAPENQGFTGRGYDGTAGWSMNMTETGLRQLEGPALAMMQRESDFYRAIKLERLYQRLTVSGKERFAGREVYVVDALPEGGNPEKLYFDVETGSLSRRDVVYGTTPVQHYSEDYRDVDGIKLPFVLHSEGPVRVITRLTEIKHNVPIDDARLKSPATNNGGAAQESQRTTPIGVECFVECSRSTRAPNGVLCRARAHRTRIDSAHRTPLGCGYLKYNAFYKHSTPLGCHFLCYFWETCFPQANTARLNRPLASNLRQVIHSLNPALFLARQLAIERGTSSYGNHSSTHSYRRRSARRP